MRNRAITELMTASVITLPPQTPLHEAIKMMQDQRISAILLMEEKQPVGIITERDLVHFIYKKQDSHHTTCAELMHSPVLCVDTQVSDLDAYHMMTVNHIRHLAVCHSDGSLAGVVTESDLTKNLSLEYMLKIKEVTNVMSHFCLALPPSATVAEAIEQMVDEGHNAVIVVDEVLSPIGILTERDIVRLQHQHDTPWQLPLKEVMVSPVLTVTPETQLTEAVELMRTEKVRRLVVVDEASHLRGTLSQHEVIQGLENDYVNTLRKTVEEQRARLADNAAQLSEKALLDNILTSVDDTLIIATDLNFHATYWNPTVQHVLGKNIAELTGCQLLDCLSTKSQSIELKLPTGAVALTDDQEFTIDLNGVIRHYNAHIHPLHDQHDAHVGYLFRARETTRLKAKTAALERSEQRFRDLFDTVSDMIFIHDAQTMAILDVNQRVCEAYGYDRETIKTLSVSDLSAGYPPYSQVEAETYLRSALSGEPQRFEWLAKRANGDLFWVEIILGTVTLAGTKQLLVTSRDITERKVDENRLERLTWAQHALSMSNSALVHAESSAQLLKQVCEAITSHDAYALAWVGLKVEDEEHDVDIATYAGTALSYMDGFKVTWGDDPLGRGPAGEAIKQDRTQVSNDMLTEDRFAPWKERARNNGLASILTTPLHREGEDIGVLAVYSRFQDAFGEEEISLFEQLADDLSYGLDTRRTRHAYEESLQEREKQAEQLQQVLEEAIGAIAATLEKRDPYTAGHEQRVADIAAAIGKEMGLDEQRLRGLHLAGIVHDIGKIQVPAEILSKPTRLTDIEYQLIQVHSQAGYDILKGLSFPWPIADMVHQHHERIDGSGYPLGLKGDEVLLESKILAVADVVEAMSSHRPYRPAKGTELALAEITSQSGTKLDQEVVEVCLRLFNERGYQLPE